MCQETLSNLYKAIPGFQRRSKFSTFAVKTASNTAISHLRSGRTKPSIPLEGPNGMRQDISKNQPLTAHVMTPDDLQNSIEAAEDLNELKERILSILPKLKDDHREVLTLRYGLEGQPRLYRELAEELGIGMEALKSRLKRAHAEMREFYENPTKQKSKTRWKFKPSRRNPPRPSS